jgi:hypothetical protein
MFVVISTLCVLSLFSGGVSAVVDCSASLDNLDPSNAQDYCSYDPSSLTSGSACILPIQLASPAQGCVGFGYAHCEQTRIENGGGKKDIEKLLKAKPVPIVLGPDVFDLPGANNASYFLQDHHHFAKAVSEATLPGGESQRHIYACVQDVLTGLDPGMFFQVLNRTSRIWLFARGQPLLPDQLPRNVQEMEDDPYFTLTRWARDSHAYIKCGEHHTKHLEQCQGNATTPFFIEAGWANRIRPQFNWEDIYTMPLDAQIQEMTQAIHDVNQFCLDKRFAHAPGYNQNPTTQPVIDVKISTSTYCQSDPF